MASYLFDDNDEVASVYSQRPLRDNEVVYNAIVMGREPVLFPGDRLDLRIPTSNISESDLVRRLQQYVRGGINDTNSSSTTTLAYISVTSEYRNRVREYREEQTIHGGSSDWMIGVLLQLQTIAERDSQIVLTVKAYRRFEILRVVSFESPALISADLKVVPERLGESASSRASGRGRGAASSVPEFASRTFSLQGQVDTVLRELSGRCEASKLRQLTELAQRDPLAFSWYISKNHYVLGQKARQRLLSERSCLARLARCASALKQASERDVLACLGCDNPISPLKAIFSVAGVDGNSGNYVNPHGHVHQTLTVREVYTPLRSVAVDRRSETKDSWFPGYAWAILTCGRCNRHLGWRFTKANASSIPSILGEGAFHGNLAGVDRDNFHLQRYWYWRSLLRIAEQAGDAPEDVINTAEWPAPPDSDLMGPAWSLPDGYTHTVPAAQPHPQFSLEPTDEPLVFYGLTSNGCVGRAFRGQEDLDLRYGMDDRTASRLRYAFPLPGVAPSSEASIRQWISLLETLSSATDRNENGDGDDDWEEDYEASEEEGMNLD